MATILLFFFCLLNIASFELVKIKIVDAPHHNRHYSSPSNTKKLMLRGPPAPLSGPPHLQALAGDCFKTKFKNYAYNVCPFYNVTQKEESGMWNRFHGVLGVWREWVIEDDKFVGMRFALGEKCGKTDREAKIMFKCSIITQLTNITEPKTCKYTIWMKTPLACFRGAMQVYRVLSPEETSKWEEIDREFQSDLITRQGLLKKRRQLLLSAGLYYNFTKDEEYVRNEHLPVSASYSNIAKNNPGHSVSACQINLAKVEEALEKMESQLNKYEKVFAKNPLLKRQLDRLLNQSNVTIGSSSLSHSNATSDINKRVSVSDTAVSDTAASETDSKKSSKQPVKPPAVAADQVVGQNQDIDQVVFRKPIDVNQLDQDQNVAQGQQGNRNENHVSQAQKIDQDQADRGHKVTQNKTFYQPRNDPKKRAKQRKEESL